MRPSDRRNTRTRRTMLVTQLARLELARALATLVDTLAEARALAAGGKYSGDLEALLSRARRELDLADEKLLVLDRHRQRSLFRRAGRIRDRIVDLQQTIATRVS